jgi:hypothetical protein
MHQHEIVQTTFFQQDIQYQTSLKTCWVFSLRSSGVRHHAVAWWVGTSILETHTVSNV